jgi:hypothetical protein
VPAVRATTLAVPLHIPDLHLRIQAGGKKKVARIGEKLDGLHTLGVARVLVNAALRDEALTTTRQGENVRLELGIKQVQTCNGGVWKKRGGSSLGTHLVLAPVRLHVRRSR